MRCLSVLLAAAVAACSPKTSDETALIRGADALGWKGTYTVGSHTFRDLPAKFGKWQVAQSGNLSAFIPRAAFEELADLPDSARARQRSGDVIINIGDARGPADSFWQAPKPGDEAGDHAGLKRYVIHAPGVVRPGDTLILPSPYAGRIHCSAGDMKAVTATCLFLLEADGLRHSFTIPVEQISAWRAYADGYLRFIDQIEA
jgi:hypothetical protein